MSLDEKKSVVHAFAEVINSHDLAQLGNVISNEYIQHRSDVGSGLEPVRHYFAELLAAFPDLVRTDEDIVAEGDKVWVRTSYRAHIWARIAACSPPEGRLGIARSISSAS
jgi:C-1 hydroxylase